MTPEFLDNIDDLFGRIRQAAGHTAYWVVDENCYEIYRTYFNEVDPKWLFVYPAAEETKNVDYYTRAAQHLSEHNVQRDAIIINIGGGVTTDFGGFLASTYRRGISFINVPTTLMGMTDAGLGGKNGVNLGNLKNVLGTFKLPLHIYICPAFLSSLPQRELLSGFAEMLKHGLISDASLWDLLKNINPNELSIAEWNTLIRRSAAVKLDIVETDFEETGERKVLNFGHTIGHAIESYSIRSCLYITHGEAIAIGMICEAYISVQQTGLEKSALKVIDSVIQKLYDHRPMSHHDINEIVALVKFDKKGQNRQVGFALLSNIGSAVVDIPVEDILVIEALHYYLEADEN